MTNTKTTVTFKTVLSTEAMSTVTNTKTVLSTGVVSAVTNTELSTGAVTVSYTHLTLPTIVGV